MGEKYGLRWYVDFHKCEDVLYERHFFCDDLGKDLVPVVQKYKASDEFKVGQKKDDSVQTDDAFQQDMTTIVPEPFSLKDWLTKHDAELASGAELNLFGDDHPDKEFKVLIVGGQSFQQNRLHKHETFLYQLRGESTVKIDGRAEAV